MSHHTGTDCGGVRDLEGIRQRCRIDPDTGCWNWGLGFSGDVPRVNIPLGVLQAKQLTTSAGKAAWLLSGRKLPAGRKIWRSCLNRSCCNPEHCKALTGSETGAALASSGVLRGSPSRAAANRRIGAAHATPPEVVRLGEALLAQGWKSKEMAKAIGVSKCTASRIKRRIHMHSSGRLDLVPQASVWGLAA